jgi:hypothetical protein
MVLWAAVSEARGGSLLALAGRCEQIEAARSSDEVRSRTTRALIPRLPAELENSDLCSCVCVCVCVSVHNQGTVTVTSTRESTQRACAPRKRSGSLTVAKREGHVLSWSTPRKASVGAASWS